MKKIFVDLDNTLTDFSKQLADLLGKKLDRTWDFGNDHKVWKKIDEAGEKFWSEMKWMPDGKELWDAVKEYKPTILTAPSRHQSSKTGKKAWLKENLPDVPYIIEEKKYKYADKDAILIDDRDKNIKEWKEAGGIAIHHKDSESSIKQLKEIMKDKEKDAGYSPYLISTPKDGGEYYTLRIPKDVRPPAEGVNLNIDGIDLVVFTVSTPKDIAKGRGGPVADNMMENGIGWSVNCLPKGHEYIQRKNMPRRISTMLDDVADKLEAMGRTKEAFHVDRIADKWEEFLKSQKAPGGVAVMDAPVQNKGPRRPFFPDTKLVNLAKQTLTDLKDQKASIIKAKIDELVSTYTDDPDLIPKKETLMRAAESYSPDVGSLISSLLGLSYENKSLNKMREIESEMSRLSRKIVPRSGFTQTEINPFKTQAPPAPVKKDPFKSMVWASAGKVDLSSLSEPHRKIVQVCLNRVAQVITKEAGVEPGFLNYLVNLIDYIRRDKRTSQDIADKIMYGKERWPIVSPDQKRALAVAWKNALNRVAKTPGEILDIVKSFGLNSKEIEVLPFDLEMWGRMTGLPVTQFIAEINEASKPAAQSPPGDNRNPVVL